MLNFTYRPIYAGEATGILDAQQRVNDAEYQLGLKEVDLANQARDEYDKVLGFLSAIQPHSESGQKFIRDYGEKINQQIATIAKDAQGNIKFGQAHSAIRNMATNMLKDQELNTIATNFMKREAEEKRDRAFKDKGIDSLAFGINGFEDITYNDDGTYKVNQFKGFYEGAGEWMKGYSNMLDQYGDEYKQALRDIITIAPENRSPEQQQAWDTLAKRFAEASLTDSTTRQNYRRLLDANGGNHDAAMNDIINDYLPRAIMMKSQSELEVDALRNKHNLDMEMHRAKKAFEGTETEEQAPPTPNYLTTVEANIYQVSDKKYKYDRNNFDETGKLKPFVDDTYLTKKEYDDLKISNPEEYAKVELIKGPAIMARPYKINTVSNDKFKDELEGYRQQLIDVGYGDMTPEQIRQMSDLQIAELHQERVMQDNVVINTLFNFTNDEILKDKIFIDKTQIPLGSADWRLMGAGKDQKKLSDATGIKNHDKISSVTPLGFIQLGEETTGLEAGSLIYQIETTDGNTFKVGRPASTISTDLRNVFMPIARFNDMTTKLPFTSPNDTGKNNPKLKPSELLTMLPTARDLDDKLEFRMIKWSDKYNRSQYKAMPYYKNDKDLGFKINLNYFESYVDTSGNIRYALKQEHLEDLTTYKREKVDKVLKWLSEDSNQEKLRVLIPTLQQELRLHRNDLELNQADIANVVNYNLQQQNFFKASVQSKASLDKSINQRSDEDF